MTEPNVQSSSVISPRQAGGLAAVGFLAFSEVTSGMLQSWYIPLIPKIGQRLDVNPAQLTGSWRHTYFRPSSASHYWPNWVTNTVIVAW